MAMASCHVYDANESDDENDANDANG